MLIFGHRGAAGYEPENTLASVRRGLELDVDYIEIDVQRTRDDVLVVFHDDLVDRLTNASGYIWDYSFEELNAGVVVAESEKIPSLREVCELVRETGGKLFVELKALDIEAAALSLVLDYFPASQFIIGSFHHEAVLNIETAAPEVRTAAVLAGSPLDAGGIVRETGCDFVALGLDNVNSRVIAEAKAEGAAVLVWTVNDLRDFARVREMGVDGVFSDFPDRMQASG